MVNQCPNCGIPRDTDTDEEFLAKASTLGFIDGPPGDAQLFDFVKYLSIRPEHYKKDTVDDELISYEPSYGRVRFSQKRGKYYIEELSTGFYKIQMKEFDTPDQTPVPFYHPDGKNFQWNKLEMVQEDELPDHITLESCSEG